MNVAAESPNLFWHIVVTGSIAQEIVRYLPLRDACAFLSAHHTLYGGDKHPSQLWKAALTPYLQRVALTCAPYHDLACAEASELRRLAKHAHKLEQIWRRTTATIAESHRKHPEGQRSTQLTTTLPGVEAVLVLDVAECELVCWDLRRLNGFSAGMRVGKTILNESTIVSQASTPNSYFIAYLTSETTKFAGHRDVNLLVLRVELGDDTPAILQCWTRTLNFTDGRIWSVGLEDIFLDTHIVGHVRIDGKFCSIRVWTWNDDTVNGCRCVTLVKPVKHFASVMDDAKLRLTLFYGGGRREIRTFAIAALLNVEAPPSIFRAPSLPRSVKSALKGNRMPTTMWCFPHQRDLRAFEVWEHGDHDAYFAGEPDAAGISVGIVDYPANPAKSARDVSWLQHEDMLVVRQLPSGIDCALVATHGDVLAMIVEELAAPDARRRVRSRTITHKLFVVHLGGETDSLVQHAGIRRSTRSRAPHIDPPPNHFCEVMVPRNVTLSRIQCIALDAGLGVVYLQDEDSSIHILRFLPTA